MRLSKYELSNNFGFDEDPAELAMMDEPTKQNEKMPAQGGHLR
ncbi:MAG: hypothetical protein ABL906_01855 [Sideroxydans sp.]